MSEPIILVDEGLGNSVHLLDLGDGRCLAVDASRDLRGLRAAASRAGLTVGYAAETHLHADFVSGARHLATDEGATVLASRAGLRRFGHHGLDDGDEVELGGLTLRALATPGHTDEHLAYLLLDGTRPLGVFTGGSLLVASAARTDLVDPDRTEQLARAQYRSLRRLLELPGEVRVWPTHGAGSFCSAPPGVERVSTIGAERAGNPLLTDTAGGIVDEDTFTARLLGGLGSYPRYFDRLAEVNRAGPTLLEGPVRLRRLRPDQVHSMHATVVDVRPIRHFGAGHVPGSLSNPLRPQFATWLGWLLDLATPLIFVRDPDQDPTEIAMQALKVGFENLLGELDGGIAGWTADRRPVATIDVLDPARAAGSDAVVLDVRQTAEYAAGHLPGSVHAELGAVTSDLDATGPLLTMCGHGERAMTAASLLAASGRTVGVLAGGPAELAAARGQALRTGE
ncbi:MAG: MBL fold metallo-hydrolase [Micromonosporaceae bacterium]